MQNENIESHIDNEPPPELQFEDQIFEIDFHPFQDYISVGLITGNIKLY